jgi:hypothetical protein
MLKKTFIFCCLLCFASSGLHAQESDNIVLEGVVMDNNNLTVPYAAIGIRKKYVGTASNEDGGFSLKLNKSNLNDSLEVSSIGYKTLKIKVLDYINQTDKVLIIEEDVFSLSEVLILAPEDYVKNATKNLKNTTLSSKHQIDMLYRRSSVEEGKTRFLVEHYLKLIDYGPKEESWSGMEIAQARKSADYRFGFRKQPNHAVYVMTKINPLRQGISLRSYNWKKVGDTSYDGDDIVIIEGQGKRDKKDTIRLYIGLENYGVYKMELSRLDALFVYKKDSDGKLVLSYHKREAILKVEVDEVKRKLLGLKSSRVNCRYRHEAIVLHVETDNKKISINDMRKNRKDIGDYEIKYDAEFWRNISLPPETNFYKKSVKELESIYNVPLETQFNLSNK